MHPAMQGKTAEVFGDKKHQRITGTDPEQAPVQLRCIAKRGLQGRADHNGRRQMTAQQRHQQQPPNQTVGR